MNNSSHDIWMQEALREAHKAFVMHEVPVGAVIIKEGQIIARAHNQVELLKDPTAHAEMIAITQATHFLQSKWLHGCTLYVTIEPCSMCSGALVLARIKHVVFGAFDSKTGACGSVLDLSKNKILNHHFDVSSGVLGDTCGALMSEFFQKKRGSK